MSERKSQQELDFERKHEEDLQRLRGLRLIDDDFMAAVFEDRTCAEFLLQIILKRDDLTVKEVHRQYSIKNLQGRSIRLDILAVDQKNRAYNIEVQRSDRGASEKRARYNSSLLDALPLKGAQVNTFRSASSFQIAVGDGLPAMPPNLGVLLVVPVHGVFLVALPVARREPDAFAVLVKVVNLSGFWKPPAVFIHCPERQQNVGVWIAISLVVDGKVSNHALGNKLLLTEFPNHFQILLFRDFHRERQHDAPGKLGVPLVLHGFHGVPERCTVCKSGWCMGRQHDFGVDKFFLLVVEFCFLVVLTE